MKKSLSRISLLMLAGIVLGLSAHAQSLRPELMYFRFDQSGSTVTNLADPSTRVSTTATIMGAMTQGSTGQWGTALVGAGGTSGTNYVQTGWTPNLGNGSWTVSGWLNNLPSNTTLYYLFGDNTAGSWRSFIGGVAGAGNIILRGPHSDILVNGIANGAYVVHFVYDNVAGQLRSYKNGVLVSTVTQSSLSINGSGGSYKIGGYATSTGCPSGGLMDEFRLYSRALTTQEIASSWDQPVVSAPAPNDAGIASIDSPNNFCAGPYPIIATLNNAGTNQLTSATIQWTLNGVAQTPVNWTGLLDTTNNAARQTQVTLMSSYNFLSNTPYTITAWATLPNGVADTVNYNDTTSVTRKAAISGTLTIGGTSPDYTTFANAIDDLDQNGLCGPVVFKVRPGTYNEQISISSITGASAINTVTFESSTGNRNDVVLSSAGTSANNYVLEYNGCDFVTFKDMTLSNTGTSYSRVVMWDNGAENCTLDNLVLNGRSVTSTSTNYAVIYSPSGSLDHNATVRDCQINNGSYAVYWYGSGSTSLERGTLFENNTWNGFYYSALYMYYQDAPIIRGNDITTMSTYTNYGVSMNYCDNQLQFVGNKVSLLGGSGSKYAVRVYYSDASGGSEGLIANNFITVHNGSSTMYALYSYRSTYKKYYFNTIHSSNTSSSSRLVYAYYGNDLDFQNNIYDHAGNGYAFYTNSTSNVSASNENVFNTNGNYVGYWSGNRATLADWQTASGMDANSITKAVTFANPATGDLHLAGASEDDPALYGSFLTEVVDDIDGDTRRLPYRGADEACYIEPNTVWFELTDGNGIQTPYVNVPGTLGIHYYVAFPDFDANITITVNLYTVPGNMLAHSESFNVTKLQGQTLDGITYLQIPALASGNYRTEAVFNTKNSCGNYRLYTPADQALMLLPGGQTPCIVWPGDVNNDGVLNYGDRKSLNQYILDANLSPVWLTGPPRYRPDAGQNPFTYLEWEAQAAVPWQTPEGCYMDADGNGTVNSFDYIPMKMNWMRSHDVSTPKAGDQFSTTTFDMSQNYPNPFNPTTRISYSVPERSDVRMVVSDLMGRTVATLVEGTIASGVYTVTFDGAALASGSYIVSATMQGLDSGLSYSKTIRMTLSK